MSSAAGKEESTRASLSLTAAIILEARDEGRAEEGGFDAGIVLVYTRLAGEHSGGAAPALEVGGVIGLGLRQVQGALNRRADVCQREFVTLSEQLDALGRKMVEVGPEQRQELRNEQNQLRTKQQELAAEINEWRDRGRRVLQQNSQSSLRDYLNGLLELEDPGVTAAVQHALFLLDAPEEELAKLAENPLERVQLTAAGRLLQRARTEYDLRGSDPAPRRREAVEFANRSGVGQDDGLLAEIEAAINDPDPLVHEIALLTAIQLHRFRALRVADLAVSHASVQRLAQVNDRNVIPVLIEIVEKPRTGYVEGEQGAQELENSRSRMVALLRLIEWHTPDAKQAVQARLFDRDEQIVRASERALELFPGEWSGPLKSSASPG